MAQKNPWYSKDMNSNACRYVELSGGGNYNFMDFSDKNYIPLKTNYLILPEFGITYRAQFSRWFSVSPRLFFFKLGEVVSQTENYTLGINDLGLLVPIDFQIPLKSKRKRGTTKIHMYAGPYGAIPLFANITTKKNSLHMSTNELTPWNYGVETGIGIRIPTFTLEASSNLSFRIAYRRGFSPLYQDQSIKAGAPLADNEISLIGGNRFNQSISLVVGIEIPMKSKNFVSFTAGGDGKKNYKKVVVIDDK
jgi:hypothetical protein